MFRATVLALAALAVVAPPARAVTYTGSGADYIRSIPATAPGPAGPPVRVVVGPCPYVQNVDGCWVKYEDTVYLRTTTDKVAAMHEVGHVFAERNLDDDERAALAHVLRPETAWGDCGVYTGATVGGYGRCPAEFFGEAYAACALSLVPESRIVYRSGGRVYGHYSAGSRDWPSVYGWYPTVKRHQRVCSMIRAFADSAV